MYGSITVSIMKILYRLFWFGLFFIGSFSASADKPNIIVFLVDDMGLMDCSVPFLTDADGQPARHPLNQFYRTPAMERLASQGICFSYFYAHSVCSPTRISIMTGQNSARHRTTQWINPSRKITGAFDPPAWNWKGLQRGTVTLPGLLKGVGYRTIFIGKAHFGPIGSNAADPLKLGFDVNIGGAPWGRPKSYYGRDHYGNHSKYLTGKKELTHNIPHLEKYYEDDVFLSEALTLEAKAEIDKAVSADQPFYMQMSHYAVHSPFQADPRFAANFENSGKAPSTQAYATLVEGVDKSLGDLLDHLQVRGVAENTLILFIGDNGSDAPMGEKNEIASSAPLRGKKATRWEGGLRVPFIAAWASVDRDNPWQRKLPIPQGAINKEMGVCYDLLPTITDFVDVPIPSRHAVDGQNLRLRLLGKEDNNYRNTFLTHFPHEHRNKHFTTYRLDQWKLIYNYNPATEIPDYQLYNMEKDLSESNNLSQSHPEKLQVMVRAMSQELEAMDALYPVRGTEVLKPVIP